jgi:hypothetical protein
VTFESSTRSLVRKDCELVSLSVFGYRVVTVFFVTVGCFITVPKPPSAPPKALLRSIPQQVDFSRTTTGHLIPTGRAYKPKASSRARQRRPRNRNMTLDNTRGSQQSVHRSSFCYKFTLMTSTRRRNKRMKYLDKPCPRFTTTGAWSAPFVHCTLAKFILTQRSCYNRCLQPWSDLHVPA